MRTLDNFVKKWCIVKSDSRYEIRRLALLEDGRAVLLRDVDPTLEAIDSDDLRELLVALTAAADGPVFTREDLLTPEFYESTRFVVQERHYYNDWPDYTDICGEDGLPLGFETEAAAQAYIEEMLDAEYAAKAAQYEIDKARADKIEELFQARKAALVAAGLWDDHALESKSWRTPRPASRGKSDDYRVVPLEESAWASE
jgi:hypothetical protein